MLPGRAKACTVLLALLVAGVTPPLLAAAPASVAAPVALGRTSGAAARAASDSAQSADSGSELRASAVTPLEAARKKPRLHYRSRGLAVIYVQQRLAVHPVTGYFGPLTRRAVKALQRSARLRVTGTTTRKTWKVLLATPPTAPAPRGPAPTPRPTVTPAPTGTPTPIPTPHPTPPATRPTAPSPTPAPDPRTAAARRPILRAGMGPGDPAVIYVQRYLSVVPASGYFGRLTTAAVRAYQKGMGIRATGVVGPLTWQAILAGRRPGAAPPEAPPVPSGPPTDPRRYRFPLPKNPTPADLAVAFAMAQVGDRYVLGGNGPDVWDCSGLVQQAYLSVGIALPRRASQQQYAGTKVDPAALRPGDLLYYQNGPSPRRGHISMYAGAGMVVEAANPRRGVRVRILNESWYAKRFVVAVRLV